MKRILAILNQIRPENDFAASHDFIADGLLDSFDVVLLVSELDKAFVVSIEGVEIVPENFKNVEAIRQLLRKHGVTE